MNQIELIKFGDIQDNYLLMYNWCSKKFIYEWFEQRYLSYKEIVDKYQTKIHNNEQDLFLIKYENKKIGFIQIYKYSGKIFNELIDFKNIYEYDFFIGEESYLSKGIGTKIVAYINKYIFQKYRSDCIVLRAFKRNIRAIKCYQKNNFDIICEYDDYDTIGNQEKIVVLVNKNNSIV